MKAYVILTSVIFGLVTIAHIWRAMEEGSHLMKEPFFLLLTLLAAALCVWGARLAWRWPKV